MNTHLIVILEVKFQKAIIIHPQIIHYHFSSMATNILKLNAYMNTVNIQVYRKSSLSARTKLMLNLLIE